MLKVGDTFTWGNGIGHYVVDKISDEFLLAHCYYSDYQFIKDPSYMVYREFKHEFLMQSDIRPGIAIPGKNNYKRSKYALRTGK